MLYILTSVVTHAGPSGYTISRKSLANLCIMTKYRRQQMDVFNLKSLKIIHVQTTEEDTAITAEAVYHPVYCIKCDSEEIVRFGTRSQKFRDLPIHCKRVEITVNRQRYRCSACKTILMDRLPDMDKKRKATKRLVRYIESAAIKKPFLSLATEIGFDERSIRRIFKESLHMHEHGYRPSTPKILGIDEVYLFRKARCVLTNIGDGCIYNILASRDKEHVNHFLHNIPNRNQIRLVCMDMWVPYRDASRWVLPHAKVVIDKFHVVKLANYCLDIIRKGLRSQLTQKQQRGLKRDRFILLRRNKDLKERDYLILQTWTENYPLLGQAYKLKEDFYNIYDSASEYEARAKYEIWLSNIPDELRLAFGTLTTAMKNWHNEIFAYFSNPVTNAYTESLNNLIKGISRTGRGYTFEILRAKVLFNRDFHRHTPPAKTLRVAERCQFENRMSI